MFLKILILTARLNTMWCFIDGYNLANNNQVAPAVFKFFLCSVMIYCEATWLVRNIEQEDK